MPPNTRPRTLLLRCAVLALIAALPVAFSVWIDPARLRPWPREERAIAQALLAGHNVTDVTNFNDRAIERLLADGRVHAPDVLSIGSSRIQALPAVGFPARSFVNAGVSGADLDDLLSVYALYDTVPRRPRRVVLNLDPWTVIRDPSPPAWGRLIASHTAIVRRLGDSTPQWRSWLTTRVSGLKRMAAPEYFRLAVYSIRQCGPSGIRFLVADRADNAEKTKTPDGTLIWPRRPPDTAALAVRDYVSRVRRGTAPYAGRDSDVLAARAPVLERFLRMLRQDGVDVDVLLVPFHPLVYAEFARGAHNATYDLDAWYRALARRTGANVVGGYDPAVAGATEADFFDELHLRPEALVRLFRR